MKLPDNRISRKQAQQIASCIVADVAAYVAAHPAEFAAFQERTVIRHGQRKAEMPYIDQRMGAEA